MALMLGRNELSSSGCCFGLQVEPSTELKSKCFLIGSLGALIPKVQHGQVGDVSDNLCQKLLSDKKADIEKRDVACIGLKTVIAEINSGAAGHMLVKRVAPQLIGSLSSTVCSCMLLGCERTMTTVEFALSYGI